MAPRFLDLFSRSGGESRITEMSGAPTARMDTLRAQFSGLPLFDILNDETLAKFESEIEWFAIPGGWELFHQGDPGDGLYIVKSGCLGVTMEGPDGRPVLATQIHPGQIVGEMSLISGLPRTATVTAFRDTEVYHLNNESFMRLAEKHPDLVTEINKMLVRRLQRMSSLQTPVDISRSFALVPIGPDLPVAEFAHSLCDALSALGFRTSVIDSASAHEPTEWLDHVERDSDLVLYVATARLGDWTRLCLRQADRVLLLADPAQPPAAGPNFDGPTGHSRVRPVEAVFLQPENATLPLPVSAWLDTLDVSVHWHVRRGDGAQMERLARLLTGRSVSLILSGGGARGFAHIGAIKALREYGMPLDIVGGTSMGAIIGAGLAMDWSDDEILERMHACFVETNPLSDLTFPAIALVKGHKVSRLLHAHFGDVEIQDLWRSYFCMTANLTSANVKPHRRGLVWRALRASVAIPGLLPPVVDSGDLLADGGVINNFPVDVAYLSRRGPLVGVDVGNNRPFDPVPDDFDRKSLLWFWRNRHRKIPGIISLLMRAGTISGDMRAREAVRHLSLFVEPVMPEVGLRDWKSFQFAIDAGYEAASRALENADMAELKDLTHASAAIRASSS
ncbi:MAG: cyclic nucleotide-binding domain-containing protein [Alphaproteobacteria bacterium]|nr:cyclic nucleotide-binding domain-containing protein [Alphaproteobacteria bacterium]